jgi:hypothetical protein
MKRRLLIFGSAFAAYAVVMAVTWQISTSQAREKTEFQLGYAIMDMHDTVAGAIDTMLGHVARAVVRHMGSPSGYSMEKMSAIAKDLDID